MTSKTTHPYYLPNQLIRSFEHYKKKGDIGKLININPSLRSESEGTAWNITVNIIDSDGGKPSEHNNVMLVINANTIGGVKPFAGTKKADAKATRQYPAVTLAFYGDTTYKLDVPEKKDRIQQYGKAKILLYQAMKKKVGDLIKAGFFGDEEVKMTNGNSQIQTSYKNEKKKVVKIEDQGKYVLRVTIPVKPEDNTFYTTIYDGSKPLPEEGDDDKSKGKSKGKSEQSQNINFDIATIEDKKDKKKRVLVGPGNIHLFIPSRTTVVFGLDHMTQLKLFNGGLSVPSKFRNEIALIPLTGKVSTMGSTLSKFIKVDTLKSSAKSSKKASSNSDGDDDENVENEDNDEENNEEGSGEDNEGNEEDNEEEGNEDDVEEADEEEVEVVKKASKSSKSSNAKSKKSSGTKSAPAKKAKKPAKKVAEEEEEELSE